MASSDTRLCRSDSGEGRPRPRSPWPGGEDSEDHGQRQQDEGDDAGGPDGVPDGGGGGGQHQRNPAAVRPRSRLPARPVSGPVADEHDVARRRRPAGPARPDVEIADGVLAPDHCGGTRERWPPGRWAPPPSPTTTPAVRRHRSTGPRCGARADRCGARSERSCPRWPGHRPDATTWSTGPAARWHSAAIPIAHPPAGRGSGHGHVAPQVHQDATAEARRRSGGRPGRRRRPWRWRRDRHERRSGWRWSGRRSRARSATSRGPARGLGPGHQVAARHLVEVPVVAQLDQGRTDGRVDDAGGVLGHAAGRLDSLEQQRADRHRGPGAVSRSSLPQLRVGAEPAAGPVEGTRSSAIRTKASVGRDRHP